SSVLSRLFLAVEHVVERRALSVRLVEIERRRNPCRHGKRLRMPKRQPQRPLSSHADAENSDGPRRQLPSRSHERHDVLDDELLGSGLGIELAADAVEPPTLLAMRTDAGEIALLQFAGEDEIAGQRLAAGAVEKNRGETWCGGRIEDVDLFTGNLHTGPTRQH